MRHRFARLLSITGCVLVLMGLASWRTGASGGLPRPAVQQDRAGAYRHDSIPAGVAMFEQLAAENNFGS